MGKLNTVANGKGSKARPVADVKKFISNWDDINWSRKETAKNNNDESNTNSTSAKEKELQGNG